MKKIMLFLLSIIFIFTLSGCGNSEEIYLHDSNSKLVQTAFGKNNDIDLFYDINTYRMKKTNDVTYVNLNEYIDVISKMISVKLDVLDNHSYNILNNDNICVINIDAKNNKLTYYREDLIFAQVSSSNVNNGVNGDEVMTTDIKSSSITPSSKSKYIGSINGIDVDLNKYDLRFIIDDDKCYVPIELISSILLKGNHLDISYNGVDMFVKSSYSSSNYGGFSSFFGNQDKFLFDETHEAIKENPLNDELYRYVYESKENDKTYYYSIVLTKDGKGGLYKSEAKDSLGEIVKKEVSYYDFVQIKSYNVEASCEYRWTDKEDGIYVNPYYETNNSETNGKVNNELDLFKIYKKDTYYGTKTRTKEKALFNLNLLAFKFETSYGLKSDKFKDGFYKFVDDNNLREKLLETDSLKYDEALMDLTMGAIDDCHTKYLKRSLYSGYIDENTIDVGLEHKGIRRKTIQDNIDKYGKIRNDYLVSLDSKYEDKSLQQGLFIEDKTAVIRFDNFLLDIPFVVNKKTAMTDISKAFSSNTCVGFDLSFDEINKDSNIENVVIDLTNNTGGALTSVAYVLAFMTNDPLLFRYSSISNTGMEYHYEVDINHDGVVDSNDTYMGKYNFYILTSEVSFSCGNLLPTIAKYKGIKIIGKKSSGGACSVYEYSDACGSCFNSSNEYMYGTFDKDNVFTNNDSGVAVDYDLDSDSWYDLSKLNQFIESIKNN